MSAIGCVFDRDGRPVEPDLLERLCDAAVAAGPDRRGVWQSGRIGLTHRLLVTTPESRHEHQPLDGRDRLVLSADARIDNRSELADLLERSGVHLERGTATDPEYILGAYRAWGLEGLSRLIGDFAFALWDGARERLVCARDRFGIRPLHYHLTARRAIFSSTIGQLLALPDLPRDLNLEVVEDWLRLGHRKTVDATIYRAIAQVPAGHYLSIDRSGEVAVRKYWRWSRPTPIRYRSSQEYADHFSVVFEQAVAARLRAAGPSGLLLSGGLDSASIAGMATGILRRAGRPLRSLRTYSFLYEGLPSVDEGDYVRPLAQFLGCDAVFLHPSRYRAFADPCEADEPAGCSDYDPTWSAAAADLVRHGGRTMLTGDGGETLLLSQSDFHFLDWLLTGRWSTLVREIRSRRLRQKPFPAFGWKDALLRFLPRQVYRRLPVPARHREAPPWFVDSPASTRRRVRRWRSTRPAAVLPSLSKQLALDRLTGPDNAISQWIHFAQQGAKLGVQYAFPFMDQRLHEFVWATPVAEFFDRGQDRAILRRAMSGLVPDRIRLRTETTLFDDWFAGHGDEGIFALLEELPEELEKLGIARDFFRRHGPETVGRRDRSHLIYLAIFMHWYRHAYGKGDPAASRSRAGATTLR